MTPFLAARNSKSTQKNAKYSVFSWRGVRENNHAHLKACCWQRRGADALSPCLLQKLSTIPPARQSASGLCTCPPAQGAKLWLLHLSAPSACKGGSAPHCPKKLHGSSWAVLRRHLTRRDGQSARWQSSVCHITGLPGDTAGQSLKEIRAVIQEAQQEQVASQQGLQKKPRELRQQPRKTSGFTMSVVSHTYQTTGQTG